ncbi:MAG TPA: BolA family protein [Burkholderiales bacterium]|nr:BolA family protein [Burkholderiales bacterium]
MELASEIRQRLAGLEPQSVELLDESGRHVGHAGAAAGGSHFRLVIVSPRFAGLPKLERHRMIYAALGTLMRREIHALAIQALAPDEL